MEIQYDLNNLFLPKAPIGLTIGMFDGLHLGHRYLFKKLKEKTQSHVVLTFSSSPRNFLTKEMEFSYLMSLDLKIKLLKEENFDLIIVLPFTDEIKQMSYDKFLDFLRKKINFSHLLLGEDASLGKNREGNKESIFRFAEENGFAFTPLNLLRFENLPITSSRIRHSILNGQILSAQKMLGREVMYLLSSGKKEGDSYYFFEEKICLPPSDIYRAVLKNENSNCLAFCEIDQKAKCIKIKKKYIDENNMQFPLLATFS